jgi:hypothetical protein
LEALAAINKAVKRWPDRSFTAIIDALILGCDPE